MIVQFDKTSNLTELINFKQTLRQRAIDFSTSLHQKKPSKQEETLVFVLLDTAAEIESMFKDGGSEGADDTADKQIQRLFTRVNTYLGKVPAGVQNELEEAKKSISGNKECIRCFGSKTELIDALTAKAPWIHFELDKKVA
ncbi:MAG: hypothetical protein WC875_02860 [Candidatus Absconditabacterales bacterium]